MEYFVELRSKRGDKDLFVQGGVNGVSGQHFEPHSTVYSIAVRATVVLLGGTLRHAPRYGVTLSKVFMHP